MKTIYKYLFPIQDSVVIMLPKGAIPMCVQSQRDKMYLWAMVDPTASEEERLFRVIDTGEPIDDVRALSYIDTVQTDVDESWGPLVWHVFEKIGDTTWDMGNHD